MAVGVTPFDFDCYEPRKWKSNLYNRDRMEVKQKMLQWGRLSGRTLLDLDGAPLLMEASVEHPAIWNHKQVEAQHIYFSRNEEARKELDSLIDRQKSMNSLLTDPTPQRNHSFLAIGLTYEGLEVALKLHPDAWVDRENLLRKLEDHYAAERGLEVLRQLPDDFCIGTGTPTTPLDTANAGHGFDVPALQAWIRSWIQATGETTNPLQAIPGQAAPPRFLCIGTTRDKKFLLQASWDEEILLQWIHNSLQHLLPLYQWLAWSRRNDHVSVKKTLRQEKTAHLQKGLEKSNLVRVVRGLWSGKRGVVQDIDTKGQLKVLVGKLSIKVDATEVEKVES